MATEGGVKKALLVGNGPSILDAPMGSTIDAFDGTVVRFNEFILEPVECTGTRTDVWIICWASHRAVYGMHPELAFGHTKVPRHIQYKDRETRFRSTGIAAMYWFLEQGYEVVLHGFDHFDLERRKSYFDHDRGTWLCKDYMRGGKRPCHNKDREMVEEVIAEGQPVRYLNA